MKSSLFKNLVGLLATVLLLGACNSSTTDLYESQNADFQSEIDPLEQQALPDSDIDLSPADVGETPELEAFNQPDIQAPPEMEDLDPAVVKTIDQVITLKAPDTRPMLDLVFVMDDSNSMENHQIRVSKAMDQFVEKLSTHDLLDYRIAVTPIYDSTRYFKNGTYGDRPKTQRVSEESRLESGERNFFRLGRLIPLRDPRGTQGNYVEMDEFYATPETTIDVLKQTLKIGAQVWIKSDEYNTEKLQDNGKTESGQQRPVARPQKTLVTEALGPIQEELLAPMVAALNPGYLIFDKSIQQHYRMQYPASEELSWMPPELDDPQREAKWQNFVNKYHRNFVRPNAHLGVIFVTDTIDHSVNLSPEMAADALRQLKNDDGTFSKISTYGVVHMNSVSSKVQKDFGPGQSQNEKRWVTRHCNANNNVDLDIRDRNSFPTAQKLEEFLNLTRGAKVQGENIFNLCDGTEDSTFGVKLARIAEDLFKNSVSKGTYNLEQPPMDGIDEVFFKNNSSRKVSSCGRAQKGELCWSLIKEQGIQKVILQNQSELGDAEIVVRYRVLDPKSINNINTNGLKN